MQQEAIASLTPVQVERLDHLYCFCMCSPQAAACTEFPMRDQVSELCSFIGGRQFAYRISFGIPLGVCCRAYMALVAQGLAPIAAAEQLLRWASA